MTKGLRTTFARAAAVAAAVAIFQVNYHTDALRMKPQGLGEPLVTPESSKPRYSLAKAGLLASLVGFGAGAFVGATTNTDPTSQQPSSLTSNPPVVLDWKYVKDIPTELCTAPESAFCVNYPAFVRAVFPPKGKSGAWPSKIPGGAYGEVPGQPGGCVRLADRFNWITGYDVQCTNGLVDLQGIGWAHVSAGVAAYRLAKIEFGPRGNEVTPPRSDGLKVETPLNRREYAQAWLEFAEDQNATFDGDKKKRFAVTNMAPGKDPDARCLLSAYAKEIAADLNARKKDGEEKWTADAWKELTVKRAFEVLEPLYLEKLKNPGTCNVTTP